MNKRLEPMAGLRPVAGMTLMTGAVGGGLAALLLARAGLAGDWLVPVFVWASLIALGLYTLAVYLPSLKARRALESFGESLKTEVARVEDLLAELERGDLVESLSAAGELPDKLRHAMENAVGGLASLVREILGGSVQVAAQGSRVRETASELASGSSEQAAAVVEITATMEELARTAAQIATNAAGQAERAGRAKESSIAGTEAVEAAVHGVEAVRDRIQAIAGHTESIDAQSGEIYRILDLISEIAHETHILALNAAIEASSAGEHGRRFSVVADEVGRLAQRSRDSVESVRSLLQDFRSSIRSSVVATEEGIKEATRVAEDARSAAMVIEGLREAIEDTSRAAREISSATEEQRSASDQVVQTIREVGDVIQKESEALRRFTDTAERLNQLALGIELLAQSFRVQSDRSLKHRVLQWAEQMGDPSVQVQVAGAVLEDILKQNAFVELAYVVDADGAMAARVASPSLPKEKVAAVELGRSYADRRWFQALQNGAGCTLTPLYDSLFTGEPCFTVAAAILNSAGETVGVLGVDINTRSWNKV